ncbi:hypothetical protein A2U01_0062785, partial [Trifolium medium]|nr:hypothetical protein [Trifolium medium]
QVYCMNGFGIRETVCFVNTKACVVFIVCALRSCCSSGVPAFCCVVLVCYARFGL